VSKTLGVIVFCFQDGRFSELAKAMEQSGFVDRLRKSQQPCTILAPSDEAFQKIPQSRLERIMSDKHAREGMYRYRMSGAYISYQLPV
jgi:uncharacterized surface protein with fasciclin (FAS1) repeats